MGRHRYEIRVFTVAIGEVRSERADDRNNPVWHKPAVPDHWGRHLAKVSVLRRSGAGTC